MEAAFASGGACEGVYTANVTARVVASPQRMGVVTVDALRGAFPPSAASGATELRGFVEVLFPDYSNDKFMFIARSFSLLGVSQLFLRFAFCWSIIMAS